MRKELYDLDISKETQEEKLKRMEEEYGIIISRTTPLTVTIKGKQITDLLCPYIPLITLIDNEYIIINDNTPYRNIHAYDLEGNWLWNIEECNNRYGKPVKYFYNVCDPETNDDGQRVLIVNSHPEVYATDLKTGKGTKIVEIYDDTNER